MAIKSIFTVLLFIFFGGLYLPSTAQQMKVDLKDLSRGADAIITGKVVLQSSNWNQDRSRIYTQATIQVEEYLKGSTTGGSVIVTYLGGEVGDVGETYSHMPRFEDQEEVLVFLQKDQKSSDYKVLYGEEGKISIIEDPKTGEKVTSSNVRINSLKTQIKSYIND